MKIEAKFTHDKVRFDQTNNVHLVLTLQAPKLDWEAKRLPVCIIPIVDVSGSMAGQKLDYAKKTLLKLVDHLKPGDFCALGTFGSDVQEVQAPIEMTQTAKDALKTKIGNLSIHGNTNFSGGLELGLRWGAKVDVGNMLVRVIMLTDGQANQGITSAEGLTKIIDTRSKTTVSCFGYGTDANQELLADLAKRGEGNYAFIKDPDEALSAFGKELGGLLSTYGQNIVLDLAPHNGHKIEEVVSDVDVEEKDQKVIIKLGDILSEEARHVVLKIKLSEQTQALPRDMNIVDIKADYDLLIDGKREHRQEELKAKLRFVKAGEEQEKPTPEVDKIVGLAQFAQAQVKAEEQAKRGNYTAAGAVMDSMGLDFERRGLDGVHKLATSTRARVISGEAYRGGQGFLRSSKGYAARGMSVSKMDAELEREVLDSGLAADFAMSNSSQASVAASFEAAVGEVAAGGGVVGGGAVNVVLAPSLVGPPVAPAEKPKGVSKSKSSRW